MGARPGAAPGKGYQLIAGERRVRAARMAGLTEVPALIREFEDLEVMQVALIENLQREDLNPIEEAEGYRRLMEEFGFTQSQAAQAVGKKRSSIANALRLLSLDEEERKLVADGLLSVGHAKVLLGVSNKKKRAELAKKVVAQDLSGAAAGGVGQEARGRPAPPYQDEEPRVGGAGG